MSSYGIAYVVWIVLFLQQIQGVAVSDITAKNEFNCNICSYSEADEGNGIACLNNTIYLRTIVGHSLKCGNYCVASEVWDKRTKKVKSIFRSCSTYWGNDCYEDRNIVNCKTSCKGDYCNNFTIDDSRIEVLCERFKCDSNGFKLFSVEISKTMYILIVTFVLIAYIT